MSHNYKELVQLGTNYAKNMNRLSKRIFGEVTRPTHTQSMKVVKMYSEQPVYRNKAIVDYYPCHPRIHHVMTKLRDYGLFRDEHQDFKEEFERLRQIRGKPRNFRQRHKEAKKQKTE